MPHANCVKWNYFTSSDPHHDIYRFVTGLAFYLAYILAFYLVYLLAFNLAYLLAFYLAHLMEFYLAYLLAFHLTFYLAYLLAFYLPVEVQQCTLSWEGPRLRSSGAH